MGYYTSWSGGIDLGRQLTLDEYRLLEDILDKDFDLPGKSYGHAWHSFHLNKEGTKLLPPEDSSKTYYWQETLQYLIDTWLTPMGIKLNGKLKWSGEESDDQGKVSIVDSVITVNDLSAQIRALMED